MQDCGKKITLAVTPGDPAGIGPDLTVALANQQQDCRIVAICDRRVLEERAEKLGVNAKFPDFNHESSLDSSLEVLNIQYQVSPTPGQPDVANSSYILKTLDAAVEGCMNKEFHAMVTGPVNKEVITRSGVLFTGHTEYIATKTGIDCPVMLLVFEQFRVALATTHIPLSEVPAAISRNRLKRVIEVLNQDLKEKFAIQSPRIAVCGVNPHAGEGGTLGQEETTVIEPLISELQKEGLNARGPYPADTVFVPQQLEKFDAVLAMYHDQGLPAIKHSAFGNVVNVTLGLPIIRTSVDHGTAYNLAATGLADSGSLLAAVKLAKSLAEKNQEVET